MAPKRRLLCSHKVQSELSCSHTVRSELKLNQCSNKNIRSHLISIKIHSVSVGKHENGMIIEMPELPNQLKVSN